MLCSALLCCALLQLGYDAMCCHGCVYAVLCGLQAYVLGCACAVVHWLCCVHACVSVRCACACLCCMCVSVLHVPVLCVCVQIVETCAGAVNLYGVLCCAVRVLCCAVRVWCVEHVLLALVCVCCGHWLCCVHACVSVCQRALCMCVSVLHVRVCAACACLVRMCTDRRNVCWRSEFVWCAVQCCACAALRCACVVCGTRAAMLWFLCGVWVCLSTVWYTGFAVCMRV